ncbi:site-specific integrase [Vibrio alginolyticus]|nr:tyrosine-type recombinase/integrase [Vibrio parahaemolyticus]ELI3522925.1 site-specific integrase [Vibrio vulnificus]HCZ9306564.1 site-specific integrase [Vibrio alginolyticus]EGU8228525.1 tyrosine-type recombinase/integrase [Vibrio parahaemolyticus]EHR6178674.1 site-specific integrase [Vibrio parahaemolyticus]
MSSKEKNKNEILDIFKKYNGNINKKDIEKICEYCNYKKFRGLCEKTVEEQRRAILKVRTIVNKPFRLWSQKDALDTLYKIYKIPLRLMHKKEFKGMPLCDVLNLLEDTDYEVIKDSTAEKLINIIKSFFKWLSNGKYIKNNIFEGVYPKKNISKANQERKAFEEITIQRIFSDEFFYNTDNCRNAKYWIVILAVLLGARQGELSQLHREDINFKDGFWYVSINKDHVGKRIKNRYSIREIPIPKQLIRLGFIDFVNSIESGQLFKDIKYDNRDGYGKDVSRWFSRTKRNWIKNEDDLLKYNFHSFRHYLINKMKQNDVNICLVSEITGHTYNNIAFERYGKDFSLKKKKRILDKITSNYIKTLPRIYPKKKLLERFLRIS